MEMELGGHVVALRVGPANQPCLGRGLAREGVCSAWLSISLTSGQLRGPGNKPKPRWADFTSRPCSGARVRQVWVSLDFGILD